MHRFFVKESKRFHGGKYKLRERLYFPIAYIKFMYYTFK